MAVAFDHDRVRDLHARLVAGDRVAPAELFALVLPELVRRLSGRWQSLRGTDAVHDAAVEVFVVYLKAPDRYDPDRSTLVGWLQFQAQGDLTNDYRSPRRSFDQRRVAVAGPGLVEEFERTRKSASVTVDAYPSDQEDGRLQRVLEVVDDPTDRALLGLIIEGDRSTSAAAAVLGINHLPEADRGCPESRGTSVAAPLGQAATSPSLHRGETAPFT